MPSDVVTVPVGAAIEAVVQAGDDLCVSRGSTGDLAVTLFRAGSLVLALGSIVDMRWAPTSRWRRIRARPNRTSIICVTGSRVPTPD